MTAPNVEQIAPRVLWGKCITFLRENKNIALQMSCGDIADVTIENGKVIAKTDEEYIFNVISSDYGKAELKKAFKWLGYDNLEFEPSLKDKPINVFENDSKRLEELFKGKLKIID